MVETASSNRGFYRLLTRLDASTRNRYCSETLDEDLQSVVQQMEECMEALAYTRQVTEASRKMITSSEASNQMSDSSTEKIWMDINKLYGRIETSMKSLSITVSAVDLKQHTLSKSKSVESVEDLVASQNTEKTKNDSICALLEQMEALLTEQSIGSWLNDAIELAYTVVNQLEFPPSTESSSLIVWKNQVEPLIYKSFRLLRKEMLRNTATHAEEIPRLIKIFKRLGKKCDDIGPFVEKSISILVMKQEKLAAKNENMSSAVESNHVSNTEDKMLVEQKKRKRSKEESSNSTSTTSTIIPLSRAEVRKMAQQCGDRVRGFSTNDCTLLDQCVTSMETVINSLSPQLSAMDIGVVSASMCALIDKVHGITDPRERYDRLIQVEVLMKTLIENTEIEWPLTARTKTIAIEYLTICRKWLNQTPCKKRHWKKNRSR